jgi:hypothetical protein
MQAKGCALPKTLHHLGIKQKTKGEFELVNVLINNKLTNLKKTFIEKKPQLTE